ncbi:MAG: TetR/AcrR family transcriptional regulator [Mycetocola sp.]
MTDTTPLAKGRLARNSLTVQAILDAAERVARAGFDALTIRSVATELEASPMALYRYFATKDDLVDALLNRVLGSFEQPDETGNWLVDLETFAKNHYAMLMAASWAIVPLTGHPNPGSNALPIGETALRILSSGGVSDEDAVAAFSGIVALNYGWASFVAARPAGDTAPPSAIQAHRTPAAFPFTAAVSSALSNYGSDAHYERALMSFLTGLTVTITHGRG